MKIDEGGVREEKILMYLLETSRNNGVYNFLNDEYWQLKGWGGGVVTGYSWKLTTRGGRELV